jgi:hypothetical protein
MLIKRNYKNSKYIVNYFDQLVKKRLNVNNIFLNPGAKELKLKDTTIFSDIKILLVAISGELKTKPKLMKTLLQNCGYDHEKLRSIMFRIRGFSKVLDGYDLTTETAEINELIQNYIIK